MPPADARPFDPQRYLEDLNRLRELVLRIVHDLHLAEDAALHALSHPLEGAHDERERWRLLLWRARKYVQEHFRSSARREQRERAAAHPESLPPAVESVERIDTARFVLERLALLEEPFRSVLTRHYLEGQSPDAIAAQDRLTRGAIHKQLRIGRERLRADLERRVGGSERLLGLLLPFTQASRAPLFRQLKSSTAPVAVWTAAAAALLFVAADLWRSTDLTAPFAPAVPMHASAPDLVGASNVAPTSSSRTSVGHEERVELRVFEGTSDARVPSASVRLWPIPRNTRSLAQIDRWSEVGLLDELTREGSTETVADARGVLEVERLAHGMVAIASSGSLWGYAVVRPEEPGPVRIELHEDADVEVLVTDEAGRALEGALVALAAIAYVGYGDESLSTVLRTRTDSEGRATLRHARAKTGAAGPLGALAQVTVGVAGDPYAQRRDIDLSDPRPQLVEFVWREPTARLEVNIEDAPKGLGSYSFCFACDRDMQEDDWLSLEVVEGRASLALALGDGANLSWRPTELRLIDGDELPCAEHPDEVLRAEFVDVTSHPPEPCTSVAGRLLDARGRPFGDRTVQIMCRDQLVASVQTSHDGKFELVVPCSDELDQPHWIVVPGAVMQHRSKEFASLAPGRGARHDLGDVQVGWSGSSARGRVVDRAGAGIANARVRVLYADAHSISSLGYSVGTTCVETRSLADGSFSAPVERSPGDEQVPLTFAASHPDHSDVVRVVKPSDEELELVLPDRVTLRGRVLLAPSLPHHRIWVEASPVPWEVKAGDSDVGMIPRAPRLALRQSQVDGEGSFEIAGLPTGAVHVRVQYYGPQSRTTSNAVVLHEEQLELPEGTSEHRLDLDVRRDFQEVVIQLTESSGSTPALDEVYVNVENAGTEYSARAACDSAGRVTLLIPSGAQAFVHSETYFDDEIDVTGPFAELQLERRPTLRLKLDGPLPRVASDLELMCPIYGQGAAYAETYRIDAPEFEVLAPNRRRFEFRFELHRGDEEQVCGAARVVELRPGFDGPYLVAPPSAEEIEAATRSLREKTERD
jgi:DNA-directed RNA polymerase specialized sigma24 family protein